MPSVQDDRQFIVETYRKLYGRDPRPDEIEQQLPFLQAGMARDAYVAQNERYFAADAVTRIYRETLGRDPKPDELAWFTADIEAGRLTRDTFRLQLAGSTEGVLRQPVDINAGPTEGQEDARDYLNDLLRDYGLEGLGDWAWEEIQKDNSPARVIQDLRKRDEYKQRFSGMEIRKANGLPAISEAEYIAYERGARQLFQAAKLPPGFFDDVSDFAGFIGGDVSMAELSDRVQEGYQRVVNSSAEARAEMQRLYGVGLGDLAAYALDETRGVDAIRRQVTSSILSGAAERSTFGGLTATQAERLASLGVTETQAEQGFGQLAQATELFQNLAGQDDEVIGRDTQIAAAFGGDAKAQEKVQRRAEGRVAQGTGSSSYGVGQKGVVGLGREVR